MGFIKYHFSSSKSGAGFTLVEMLVVLAIIGVLSSVILLNNRQFDSQIALTNLAHSIALTIREAQVYGTSVRDAGGSFDYSYGAYFHENNPTTYYLFVDSNGDHNFDVGEEVETFEIGQGNFIADVCVEGSCGGSVRGVVILFSRPNPNASIYRCNPAICSQLQDDATIIIESASENTKEIYIHTNGQISVR